MLLLDDTTNRGSDARSNPNQQRSPGQPQGDSFSNGNVDGVTPKRPAQEREQPEIERLIRESQLRNASRQPDGQDLGYGLKTNNPAAMHSPYEEGDEGYGLQTINTGAGSESYQSQTEGGRDSNFRMPRQKPTLVDRARDLGRQYGRGKNEASKSMGTVGQKLLGDKAIFFNDSEENRDRVKELASEKAGKYLKDKIADKVGNKAFKEGLQKGGTKALKSGAKKLGKEVVEQGVKGAARTGTKVGARVAAQAGIKTAEAATDAVLVGTSEFTFGLGIVLAIFLDIAINLGVGDAVDAGFALSKGDLKEANFLATRAAMKVIMFIFILAAFLGSMSPIGVLFAFPVLVLLHIYMLLGVIFPTVGILQGITKLERYMLFLADFMLFNMFMMIMAVVIWYACDASGFGSGGWVDWGTWLAGWTPVGALFNWITGGVVPTINEICRTLKSA